jgi:hypothetical protein
MIRDQSDLVSCVARKKEDERKEWLRDRLEERFLEQNRPAPQNGYKGLSDAVENEPLMQSRYARVFASRNIEVSLRFPAHAFIWSFERKTDEYHQITVFCILHAGF